MLIDHGISAPLNVPLWIAVRPENINLSSVAQQYADNWAHGVIRESPTWATIRCSWCAWTGREVRANVATPQPESNSCATRPCI